MTKKELLQKISFLEEDITIIKQDRLNSPTAKEWLVNYMKQQFAVKLTPFHYVDYYLDGTLIFRQDIKFSQMIIHTRIWTVLSDNYMVERSVAKELLASIVLRYFDLKDYNPMESVKTSRT